MNTPTKKYWFAQKTYGYGLVPISLEGWMMTLLLVVTIMASAYVNSFFTEEPTGQEIVQFLLDTTILTTMFIILSMKKMRGELAWRWGNKTNDDACSLKQPH